MRLSLLYPKQLLTSGSGVLVGTFDRCLNSYCVVALSQNSVKDVRKELEDIKKCKNFDGGNVFILGTQKSEKINNVTILFCSITCRENYDFSISVVENGDHKLSTVSTNWDYNRIPLLFLYDQQSIHYGIDSLPEWSCSKLDPVDEQVDLDYNENFSMLNRNFIEFLFKSNLVLDFFKEKDFKVSTSKTIPFLSRIWTMIVVVISIFQHMLMKIRFPTKALSIAGKVLKLSSFGSQICLKFNLLGKLSQHNKKNLHSLLKVDILFGIFLDIQLGILFYLLIQSVNGTFDDYTFDMLMSSINYIGKEVSL